MILLCGFGKLIEPEIHETECAAGVYALFARLWMREVDEAFRREMFREPLAPALERVGLFLPMESNEELAIEYCRLFIGPKNALLPMQSVWQKTQLESQLATSVEKFAELIGYVLPTSSFWDHLGVQLDLMSHLVRATASEKQAENGFEVAGEVANVFFKRHLSWAAPLLLATSQRAQVPLYRSLAQATQQFLRLEASSRSQATL